jgi:hypothetical protein
MDAQLEAFVALDDWYIALQRIRGVVAAAETYTCDALRESVRPLWQDAHQAQARLRAALGTLAIETSKARKPVEIEKGCDTGWQETLRNGERTARVSVVGERVTVALEGTESNHAREDAQLCLSCKTITEECPRCGADARPAPVHAGGDTWTEFRCSSCNFRFPDNGKNGLCAKCLKRLPKSG